MPSCRRGTSLKSLGVAPMNFREKPSHSMKPDWTTAVKTSCPKNSRPCSRGSRITTPQKLLNIQTQEII